MVYHQNQDMCICNTGFIIVYDTIANNAFYELFFEYLFLRPRIRTSLDDKHSFMLLQQINHVLFQHE